MASAGFGPDQWRNYAIEAEKSDSENSTPAEPDVKDSGQSPTNGGGEAERIAEVVQEAEQTVDLADAPTPVTVEQPAPEESRNF